MTIDKQTLQAQQQAAFAAVQAALGDGPAEFETAGELAALMAKLPADTPVSVVETVHIDPDLALGVTPNCTAAAATIVHLVEQDAGDVVDDGQIRQDGRVVPGVELGAYIVAEGARVPARTVPFQPYERAVQALDDGDLDVVLDSKAELLNSIAATLAPPEPDDTWDADMVPKRIGDPDLRDQLAVEGERLRQAAARLAALRAQVAAHQAAEDDEAGE